MLGVDSCCASVAGQMCPAQRWNRIAMNPLMHAGKTADGDQLISGLLAWDLTCFHGLLSPNRGTFMGDLPACMLFDADQLTRQHDPPRRRAPIDITLLALLMWGMMHCGQDESWEDMAKRPRSKRVRRSSSFSSLETLRNIATAGDVIRAAGYPLEEHTVTTSDGYVQQMERIPRHGALLLLPA